jgi:uncharacterized protein YcgI (DUF1989 family)
MKTIEPQSGIAFILKKGDFLKVVDPQGKQVSDLFCFQLDDPREALSAGRSIDYADSIFLKTGDFLFSNRSNKMLKIVQDSCGRHDFLLTPCSLKMFQIVANEPIYHKSCHENLSQAFEKFKIEEDSISTTFNIFMNVEVEANGRLKIEQPLSRPGDSITFEAYQDLIVGLTACSHEETNAGFCKPIFWQILDSF